MGDVDGRAEPAGPFRARPLDVELVREMGQDHALRPGPRAVGAGLLGREVAASATGSVASISSRSVPAANAHSSSLGPQSAE